MPHTKGLRHRSRKVLSKSIRERGLSPLSRLLIKHNPGDKVVIDIDPSIHKGMPHRRMQGKVGTVLDKRGKCYVIKVFDGNKEKVIIARPEHIKRLQ